METYKENIYDTTRRIESTTKSVDPHTVLAKRSAAPDKNIQYREAVSSLIHLAIVSRPDIMYGVRLVRYLNCYDHTHCNVVKKIMKYLKETQNYDLCYQSSNSDANYAKDTVMYTTIFDWICFYKE